MQEFQTDQGVKAALTAQEDMPHPKQALPLRIQKLLNNGTQQRTSPLHLTIYLVVAIRKSGGNAIWGMCGKRHPTKERAAETALTVGTSVVGNDPNKNQGRGDQGHSARGTHR